MKYLIASLFFSLVSSHNTFGQYPEFYDEQTDEDYMIRPDTEQKVIDQYLKSIGAKAIEFNEDSVSWFNFPYKLESKKGWQLFSNEEPVNETPYDSIGFPSHPFHAENLMVVKDKGSYGILSHKYGADKPSFTYEGIRIVGYGADYYDEIPQVLAKKSGKWGRLLGFGEHPGEVIEPFVYEQADQVPLQPYFGWQARLLKDFRKQEQVDQVILSKIDRYYLKARHRKTHKWGFYVGEGVIQELVPPKYDSIIIHKYTQVYAVWNDSKVGYYYESNLVKPTEYDDFKLIHLDYMYGCALKKDGEWGLYDSFEGTPLMEEKASSTEELVELWLGG